MESEEYGKGSFLIANPVLPDPNFSRTVVLLCNHNEEWLKGIVASAGGAEQWLTSAALT